MKDAQCVEFLQWALPRLQMRWPGFRKVRKQVCKRIDPRLRELQLPDLQAYCDYLQENPAEWDVLDRCCRIPISRFYRDHGVFDCLRDEVLPGLASEQSVSGADSVDCWSAGCASGEEVYTLKIIWNFCLQDAFPDLRLRIVATDVDPHMLERARAGCYSMSSLKELPSEWRARAFDRADDLFCLKPEHRRDVAFRLQDIRAEMPQQRFQLILCRHLAFTYFDEQLQRQTFDRLIDRLTPGGFLVGGKQEPLPALPAHLREYRPRTGVYRCQRGSV